MVVIEQDEDGYYVATVPTLKAVILRLKLLMNCIQGSKKLLNFVFVNVNI